MLKKIGWGSFALAVALAFLPQPDNAIAGIPGLIALGCWQYHLATYRRVRKL